MRLISIAFGSLMFVLLKTGLVAAMDYATGWPPWLIYLIVTVSVSWIGWIYHSKVSFGQPLNRRTLRRYVEQAVGLKLVDYVAYNFFVYLVGVDERLSVLVTGAIVFTARTVIYMVYVFAPSAQAHAHAVPSGEASGRSLELEGTSR